MAGSGRAAARAVLQLDLEDPKLNRDAARSNGVFVAYVSPDFTSGYAQVIAARMGLPVRRSMKPLPGPAGLFRPPEVHAWVTLPNDAAGGRAWAAMNLVPIDEFTNRRQGGLRMPPAASAAFKAGHDEQTRRIAKGELVQLLGLMVYGAAGAAAGSARSRSALRAMTPPPVGRPSSSMSRGANGPLVEMKIGPDGVYRARSAPDKPASPQPQFRPRALAVGSGDGSGGKSDANRRGPGTGPSVDVRSVPAPRPRAQAARPTKTEQAFGTAVLRTLVEDPGAQPHRNVIVSMLDNSPDYRFALQLQIPIHPGHLDRNMTAEVTVTRTPGKVTVSARGRNMTVTYRLAFHEGRIVVPWLGLRQPPTSAEGWRPGGFRNDSGDFALPAAFWDRQSDLRALEHRLIRDARGRDTSWTPLPQQIQVMLRLFEHRDMLQRLMEHRFKSLKHARSTLVQVLSKMDRETPGVFVAETGWHIYPREDADGTWGVGLSSIGTPTSAWPFYLSNNLPSRMPMKGATRWHTGEYLHTHPDRRVTEPAARTATPVFRETVLGFSAADISVVLSAETPLLVYDNGAVFRASPPPAWFALTNSQRQTKVQALDHAIEAVARSHTEDPAALAALRTLLQALPVRFQRIGGIDRLPPRASPVGWGFHELGPSASTIEGLPFPPAPAGILSPPARH